MNKEEHKRIKKDNLKLEEMHFASLLCGLERSDKTQNRVSIFIE